MTTYQIVEATLDSKVGYQPFGAALDLWNCHDSEVIISGPAETGKTRVCLEKLDAIAWKYPNAHLLIARKTRQSMGASVIKTYQDKVLTLDTPIEGYGGHNPQWFDYPNGSRIVLAGLDKAGKVLSAEYDVIYVNQAEELTLDDWETLTTRATGRAGNVAYPQVIGDCNPGPRTHWIRERARSIAFLESRHEDNPVLYDQQTGEMTEQGERTMAVLDALTGVRYERLRKGRWASAEGAVYEFDDRIHLIDSFDIPADWRRFRAIDFGYTNPFVCQWWALDHDDRMYLYREIYMSQRLVEDHARQIVALTGNEVIEATVADHDAEDRATLHRHGVHTIAAQKEIGPGIQAVQQRLRVQPDGKPRLFIMRGALVERDEVMAEKRKPIDTHGEIGGYVWPKAADGKPVKEAPVKVDDHGVDPMRYLVRYLDQGGTRVLFEI